MESWYCYANGPRGRAAKNGDLRLVIGWDKAEAWGMAAFSHTSEAAKSFRLDFKSLEEAGGRSYKWEYSGIADGRTGPSAREVAELRDANESEDVIFANQCLFIRTMNHSLSDDVWAKLKATKFGTIKTEGLADYDSLSGTGQGKSEVIYPVPSPKASNQVVHSSSNVSLVAVRVGDSDGDYRCDSCE